MKKIVINGKTLFGEENFGIRRFTQEILKEMDAMVNPGEIEIIVPKIDENCINFKNIKLVEVGSIAKTKNKIEKKLAMLKWDLLDLPRNYKRKNVLSVDTQLRFPLCGSDVIAIHDCIPELFPQMYKTSKQKLGRVNLICRQKIATKKSKLVITVSEFSKRDIQKFYSVPEDNFVVISNAWQHFLKIDEDVTIFERLGIEKNSYFFALGSRSYHKNAKWVLAAAEKNPNETFVITGSSFGREDKESKENRLKNVIFTGYLNDKEVKALMHFCKAFIQPSFYEGFGIPPMEAMSVGADCIVANAGSLPEVYSNSVWYIDPHDYENINLKEIMNRPKESNNLILEKYSWKKSAEKLLKALRLLAQ